MPDPTPDRDRIVRELHREWCEGPCRSDCPNLNVISGSVDAGIALGKSQGRRVTIGGAAHVAVWDAINRYAEACGGEPSRRVYGNTARQRAVADVDAAIRALASSPPVSPWRPGPPPGPGEWWVRWMGGITEPVTMPEREEDDDCLVLWAMSGSYRLRESHQRERITHHAPLTPPQEPDHE